MPSSSLGAGASSSTAIPKKRTRTRAPSNNTPQNQPPRRRTDGTVEAPSLDILPLEILRATVRLLPPRTVYAVLPRISRWMRSAVASAVPDASREKLD
ncbi:hypothetical protein M427DRAFT_58323 [Gonapodya prolifera JEL478]|uniref:Uncharacterized protein n=1 Tax=Gonapodya prolifera (strain JEL478) TaxID=1344416 RepID=A0A139AAK4_GONPJ|nr:hypothetical protein M427DRAFT_58323 [Gonapodya prolifera JEL478]|eukprot:KXS13728.1 hypothetical protein M427DRAFT_58323 [Gonapodya prolifera JEL478]